MRNTKQFRFEEWLVQNARWKQCGPCLVVLGCLFSVLTVRAPDVLLPGKATIRMNFDYEVGGVGKGGLATLLVNGKKVSSRRIERTQPMIFSADETARVGIDDTTPVTTDYTESDIGFTGKILKVTVEVQPIGAAVKAQAEDLKILQMERALDD